MDLSEVKQAFPGLPDEDAQSVVDLVNGERDPMEFEQVEKWVEGCYNEPDRDEQILVALNELIGGYGVEGITPEGEVYPVADYVNMGDTYATTILRDLDSGEFLITNWGDWLQDWKAENISKSTAPTVEEEEQAEEEEE